VKEEGESEAMNAEEALTVYPNPFSKNATIEFSLISSSMSSFAI
jgi:hypothetical protein